ncbi:28S ribosomal protein S31, mitochondrial-like isoform X2 [Homarus americanus]|uniref:Small ribosomal subunit protein mS31 n=2 Tax=Homarus americanus TaxID=6706 RepID=A0A8J5JY29_HOMAM|nr:28S ribosomal protein S31, mitochondrial-like isoform X2 [Homarus americanus]KAG7165972.1 28S ribosomal protein S31-like [Homarus americanus]
MKDRPQAFENDKEEKPEQSYDKKIIFQVNHDHHTNERQEASQMGELPVTEGKHDINTDFSCNEKQVRSEDELTMPQDVTVSASKEEQVVKEHSPVEKSDDRRATAQKKLHDLLTSLASADPIPVEPMVRLSRPKARQKKTGTFKEQKKATEQPTESVIEPELVLATKEVAESLGGDVETTESELLSTLRLHSTSTSCDDKPAIQLSDLFVGMKVERNPRKPVKDLPRHKRYDQDTQQSSPRSGVEYQKMWPRATGRPVPRTLARVELFGTEHLDIFNAKSLECKKEAVPTSTLLPVWEVAHKWELQQSVSHPNDNAFTEMIQWTKQGKLWTFPINNEVGLEEEKSVGFHEHIFLEQHLEGWCPRRGPIRHFMELVCTGLSKNPHLTVERKQAHIQWYKNYFAEKEEILKEIGAIETSQ